MTAKNGRQPATERKTLLLTIPETAEELRVHRDTVYTYIADGLLNPVDLARPGSKVTCLRVPLDELKAFIASRPRVHAP
ncbi:helix-turn-helix domain-containing protein [Nonomuraea sp. SYSU D8015]|uniref:helix-turn-helix domain-containing protein n=1 Tax=Nonomuraea sp. SYSU D8015 TaxID=2593644 RepID=UPI0016614E78|nr:helix-turn-helix domain-containing protein [Nonomuraea sp. SYSU D8015]